ncbi:PREDICTED: putative disease resistance RPP13-like protein 3 [Ipomoea nil]|uniref:putative disease resistance RPP13-like protein 3 n=1 Tax=Ipomoea nil TaxID=35883 RepID=UPI00090173BB|nr:PREDICTED: putative disease resistance RPP13-like protein 3 [Ipomoea nil]
MAFAAATTLMDILHHNFLQSKPLFTLRTKRKVRSLYRNLCFVQTLLEEDLKVGNVLEARIRDVSVDLRFQIEQQLTLLHLGKAMKIRLESALELLPIVNWEIQEMEAMDFVYVCARLRKHFAIPVPYMPAHIRRRVTSLCEKLEPRLDEEFSDVIKLEPSLDEEFSDVVKLEPSLDEEFSAVIDEQDVHFSIHLNANLVMVMDVPAESLPAELILVTLLEAKILIIQESRASYLRKYTKQMIEARQRLRRIFSQGIKHTGSIKKKLLKIKNEFNQSRNSKMLDSMLGGSGCEGGNLLQHTLKSTTKMVVGCNEDFNTIMDKLNRNSLERVIVSIVGMGGIGKTTLARSVYEDVTIISHFDCRAWVSISQEYNPRQVLQCILHSLDSWNGESNDELSEQVYKCLKRKRYLIIIDDIWRIDVWSDLLKYFPEDKNGSRILLTTRLKNVAEYASTGSNSYHNMSFLDSHESWSLFHHKVSEKIALSPQFESIGRDIVDKCKGLPLAIIVTAGLLSKSKQTLSEWEHIAKNVSALSLDDQQFADILSLSYTFLPHHLKPCFLSFGIFPKGSKISVDEIVHFWLSEGFLKVVKSKGLEDVAKEYIQDLIDRNLVQVYRKSCGEIKECQMHDVLLELVLREAERENLLYKKEDGAMSRKHRREPTNYSPNAQQWITQLRISALWFSDHIFFKLPSAVNFKLLRVLVLSEIDNTSTLRQIMSLVHLRILKFHTLLIGDLPWFMLSNLKILVVAAQIECEENLFEIWGLPQLRHLCFYDIYCRVPPRSIQENLHTIRWLDCRSCTKELFMRAPNLMDLGVQSLEDIPECKESNWFKNLAYLYKLQKLKIRGNIISWGFRTTDYLEMLSLENFLPNLKTLKLAETKLDWKDMDVIGKLPKLEVLKLKNAVDGPKWESRDGGFRRLKHLLIHESYLRYWEATDDHFPNLECLVLRWCSMLEEIPSNFADIATLQLIELNQCSDSSITSAERIQQVQQDSGNDTFVLRYDRIPREGKRHSMVFRIL